MNCKNCNAPIPDDSAFCPECGAKVEPAAQPVQQPAPAAKVFCPNCGAAMAPEDAFCENCGAKVAPAKPAAAPKKSPLANIPKKYLRLGGIVVAAVLVIAILISIFAGMGSKNNYALYVKDGELVYTDNFKPKDFVQVTDDLSFGQGSKGESMSSYIHLSKDGKRLFFPDKASFRDYGYMDEFTLYYRDISKPDKEPEKIVSGISSYSINEKCNLITYIKSGNLYQHNLEDQEKIDSDVRTYRVSKDGKTLVYMVADDDEGILYRKKSGKDPEKIASGVTNLVYASEDMAEVIYSKEDSLYIQSGSKDAEKISSDVKRVYSATGIDSFYYTKCEEREISVWDLIDDDLKGEDQYDRQREQLKEHKMEAPSALYYYNGKESVKLSASAEIKDYSYMDAMLYYIGIGAEEDLPKVKFSKIVDGKKSVMDLISDEIEEASMSYLAHKDTVSEIKLDDVATVYLGEEMAFISTMDEDGENGCLYSVEIGKKIGEPEKYAEDLESFTVFVIDDKPFYFKDVKDDIGELYWGKEKVDDDVYMNRFQFSSDLETVAYLVDWDADHQLGTLKTWRNGKDTKVKDDVNSAYFTPEDELLFLYDYNGRQGELWIKDGKKIEKLYDDVQAIVPVWE